MNPKTESLRTTFQEHSKIYTDTLKSLPAPEVAKTLSPKDQIAIARKREETTALLIDTHRGLDTVYLIDQLQKIQEDSNKDPENIEDNVHIALNQARNSSNTSIKHRCCSCSHSCTLV